MLQMVKTKPVQFQRLSGDEWIPVDVEVWRLLDAKRRDVGSIERDTCQGVSRTRAWIENEYNANCESPEKALEWAQANFKNIRGGLDSFINLVAGRA